ncbi:MAG: hypothetical protein AAB321_03455, partial [Chloroflexota bacterium]
VTKRSQDIGNTLSKDMGNTSLTGGATHALERCYRERTATEVPRRLPAELLPRYRARRAIWHLEEDSLPWPDHQPALAVQGAGKWIGRFERRDIRVGGEGGWRIALPWRRIAPRIGLRRYGSVLKG